MEKTIYIGMDVHTTNYTLCAYSIEGKKYFAETQIEPDIKLLVKYFQFIQEQHIDAKLICGYEAGCLGYSLHNQITAKGYECVILAPTKIPHAAKEIKTDKRDARKIAEFLAHGTYYKVHVISEEDNAVKEYIRMRDDSKDLLKRTKQQIIALCIRQGKIYDGRSYWTQAHLKWLKEIDFGNAIMNETLNEYMITFYCLIDKIERFDKRIEELAQLESYAENAKKLGCFVGIKTHTAMSFLSEIGDFRRFPTANQFASFLGLVPGERSSSDSINRLGITKSGNSHLRRLLTEAANSFSRTKCGRKSKTLKLRQDGNSPDVIAYADKANERLRRKYVRIAMRSKSNIAKCAVARELACYIWGMMNEKIN